MSTHTHIALAGEQERNNCEPENYTMMRYYFFCNFFFLSILFLLSCKTIVFTFKTTATAPASSAEVKTEWLARGDYIRREKFDATYTHIPTRLSETRREEKGIRINSR